MSIHPIDAATAHLHQTANLPLTGSQNVWYVIIVFGNHPKYPVSDPAKKGNV